MGLLSVFAVTLLSPAAAEWISRPFTRLGGSLHQTQSQERGILHSFILGAATGLLLGAVRGPDPGTHSDERRSSWREREHLFLLLAYALGAATSLAAALLTGSRVLRTLRGYLGYDVWVRRILGSAVLIGVLAIALGWDRSTLTRLSASRPNPSNKNYWVFCIPKASLRGQEKCPSSTGPLLDQFGSLVA